jgi:hypothetical protein
MSKTRLLWDIMLLGLTSAYGWLAHVFPMHEDWDFNVLAAVGYGVIAIVFARFPSHGREVLGKEVFISPFTRRKRM